jgi:hypothetical protein
MTGGTGETVVTRCIIAPGSDPRIAHVRRRSPMSRSIHRSRHDRTLAVVRLEHVR